MSEQIKFLSSVVSSPMGSNTIGVGVGSMLVQFMQSSCKAWNVDQARAKRASEPATATKCSARRLPLYQREQRGTVCSLCK